LLLDSQHSTKSITITIYESSNATELRKSPSTARQHDSNLALMLSEKFNVSDMKFHGPSTTLEHSLRFDIHMHVTYILLVALNVKIQRARSLGIAEVKNF